MPSVVLEITGDSSSAIKAMSQVGNAQSELSSTAKKASDDQRKGAKSVADANKTVNNSIKELNKSIIQTATNILSVGAAASALKSLGANVLNTRAEFQKFEAVLTNTLGSNSLAQTALKNIQEFASKTPFGVKELTEDFVKLANTGFKPTTAEMTKLGDLAASQGKSFDMLTEALIDAQTGEFERLKEFGIRASKEGDKVTLSFKDQKVQVDNNNESIRNAILAFGDLEGVAGGMAAISETLGGKISNLDDNIDALYNNLGENTEGVFGVVISAFNDLLGTVNNASSAINEMRRNLKAEGFEETFVEKLFPTNEVTGAALAAQTLVNQIKSGAEETKNFKDATKELETAQIALGSKLRVGQIDQRQYDAALAITNKGLKDLSESSLAYDKDLEKGNKPKQATTDHIKKMQKANDDFAKSLENLSKKAKEAENAGLSGTEKINADLEQALKTVDEIEKKLIEDGIKAEGAGFKLEQEQLDQLNTLRVSAQRDANEKLLKLQKESYEKAKKDQEDADKDAIDQANQMVDENQKILEDANKAKILLTKEGTKERLDAEIEAIETERDFILQNTTLTNDQRIILVQETLQKIADLRKGYIEKQPSKLADLLGISDEELEKVKDGLSKVADQLKQFFSDQIARRQELLDKELELNEQSKEAQEDKISDLQSRLDEELDLQKRGLANNVDAIRQQIADEEAARQAGLENEKRIREEKRKLQLQQLVVDSLGQASSLLSAGATLFAEGAFSGPVGIVTSIATIAGMVAAFLALKAQIQQVTQQGFKEGGYTGDYGVNEVAGAVHGQEFVSTARTTKKHRPILEALHKEDYSHLTIKDLMPILEGTGVTFNGDVLKEIRSDQASYNHRKAEEPMRLISAMEATNKNINKFFEHYKKQPKPPIIHPDGSIEIKDGNTTRRIRKR